MITIEIKTGKDLLDSGIKHFEVINGLWIGKVEMINNHPWLYVYNTNGELFNFFEIKKNTVLDLLVIDIERLDNEDYIGAFDTTEKDWEKHCKEAYKDGDQNGYERGYKQGWDKGYSNGEFLGRAKLIKEMKQFMLETFGGDDGTGNLNKIYEHLDGLEEKINER